MGHRDDEGNEGEEVSRDGAMTLVLMVAVAAVLFFTVVMIVAVSFIIVMMIVIMVVIVMIMFVFVVTAAFLFLRIDQRVETEDDDANPSGEDERVEVLGKVILNALRVIEIDQRTAPAKGEQSKEPGVES
jgi:membrane protein implicated in regulation of membrane protease activity